jgi:hypothetical protein
MSGKILSDEFLAHRIMEVNNLINQVEEIKINYSKQIVLSNPETGKWTVVQVLAHLNSYNRYYLDAIEAAVNNSSDKANTRFYKPGLLGAYFTRLMLPDEEGQKSRKMKSPKNHIPPMNPDAETVINEFLSGEKNLLRQLEKSKKVNLMKTRVPISLNRFLKLQLGDTFHFLVAHQQRHFLQIQEILKN